MGQKFIVFPRFFLAFGWRNIESEAERKTFRQIRFVFSPIEDKLCTGKREEKQNQSDVFSDETVFLFCGSADTMRKLVVYFPSFCSHRFELGGTSGFAHRYQSIHFTRLWFIDRFYFKKTRNTKAKWVSRCSHSGSALAECRRRRWPSTDRVPLPACSCCSMMKATFRVENIVGVPLTHFDAVDNFPSRFLINHREAECKLHSHGGSNDEWR